MIYIYIILSIIVCYILYNILLKKRYYKNIYYYSKRDAIKCWNKIFNQKYIPPKEDNVILSGRFGENFLKEYISKHPKFNNCKIFCCKRIFNRSLNRKNEIDMIVISDKKIYVIECKNWKGDVIINNNIWKYITNVNGQSCVTIYDGVNNKQNPVELTKDKSVILYKYLKDNGISLDIDDIDYKVIFINKNMKVFGDIDKSHIILYDELYNYMNREDTDSNDTLLHNIFISLLNLFIDEESVNIINNNLSPKIGKENRKNMIRYIESLPSWDYVKLGPYGGANVDKNYEVKIYQGDLRRYENIFYNYIDFNSINKIYVKKDNNKIKSLINILFGSYPLILYVDFLDGRREKYICNPDGYIIFQESGHPDTINIDILKIDEILINSKGYLIQY